MKLGRAQQALDMLNDALGRHPQDRRLQELAAKAEQQLAD